MFRPSLQTIIQLLLAIRLAFQYVFVTALAEGMIVVQARLKPRTWFRTIWILAIILYPLFLAGRYFVPDTFALSDSSIGFPTFVGPTSAWQRLHTGHRCVKIERFVDLPYKHCINPDNPEGALRTVAFEGDLDLLREKRTQIYRTISTTVRYMGYWNGGACCTRVEIGSERGIEAWFRRWLGFLLQWIPVGGVLPSLFGLVLLVTVLSVLTFVIVSIVLVGWRTFTAGIRGVRVAISNARPIPLTEWTNAAFQTDTITVVCQLSDIHQCNADGSPLELIHEPWIWPRADRPTGAAIRLNLGKLLRRILKDDKPVVLAITGDITDAGLEGEWEMFYKAFKSNLLGWRGELLVVPGNHDVCVNSHGHPDLYLTHRRERDVRCSGWIHRLVTKIGQASASQPARGFPRLSTVRHEQCPFHVLQLDSNCYRSRYLLSNAIGEFGKRQLDEASALLLGPSEDAQNERATKIMGPLLVMMHHHISKPLNGRFDVKDLLMRPVDASKLVGILDVYANNGGDVLIIHGHKHMSIIGTIRDTRIKVLGLPSSTLGKCTVDSSVLTGDLRYARIGLTPDGRWCAEELDVGSFDPTCDCLAMWNKVASGLSLRPQKRAQRRSFRRDAKCYKNRTIRVSRCWSLRRGWR